MTELQLMISFAKRYNIPATDAYVLPALFTRVAELSGLSRRDLLLDAALGRDRRLGDYLASVALSILRTIELERASQD